MNGSRSGGLRPGATPGDASRNSGGGAPAGLPTSQAKTPPSKEQVAAELQTLMDSGQQLQLVLGPVQVMTLLSQLQLALRHPGNVGPVAGIAREIAAGCEAFLARVPGLADLASMGWNSDYDVPVDRG